MTPLLRSCAWAAIGAVGMTGLLVAWMAYLLEPRDPMDVVNHPWQPGMLHLHVLTAPVLVFVVGALWPVHVWPRLWEAGGERRRSGWGLVVLFLPMAATGYLLQVLDDPDLRSLASAVHVIASLGWLAALGGHAVSPVLAARRRARTAGRRPAGIRNTAVRVSE